jgi:DtxR family Mn-dependent transcriptional regulator
MKPRSETGAAEGPRPQLSEAQEDYLKQIFLLSEGRERVATQMLARRLEVRPASVTEMIGRLSDLGLVEHTPYRGVRLSSAGRRVALEMLRHHRLLETFLVEELGYRWDEVHEEADRLEHVISERFEARIAEAVGHPTHDPHGDPIPDAELGMPDGDGWLQLTKLPKGGRGTVTRVGSQDTASLTTLRRLGLGRGTVLEVVHLEDHALRLEVGGEVLELPEPLAEHIWVEEITQ